MHILLIPSWYPRHPGDARGCFFREQAIALREAGHEVGVLAVQVASVREWRNAFRKPGVHCEVDEGVRTYRISGLVWPARFPSANAAFWRLFGAVLFQRYVKSEGLPDILHVHGMLYGGVLGQALSRRHGLPFVVTEHSSFYGRELMSPRQLRTAASVAGSASARLAVSRALCRELQQRLQGVPGGWEEVPNIVDARFFAAPSSTRRSAGAFVFLAVALLTRNKGMHVLIEAFARAFPAPASACLRIGGDGAERSRLESLARDLGVADRVTFLGILSREEAARQMTVAHAVVLPSEYETFSLVTAEALACGTPVLATRCGGPESIVRAQDGMLVPVGDVSAMADALSRMTERPATFDPEEIRAACLRRFGSRAVASRLSAVYERLREPGYAEARA